MNILSEIGWKKDKHYTCWEKYAAFMKCAPERNINGFQFYSLPKELLNIILKTMVLENTWSALATVLGLIPRLATQNKNLKCRDNFPPPCPKSWMCWLPFSNKNIQKKVDYANFGWLLLRIRPTAALNFYTYTEQNSQASITMACIGATWHLGWSLPWHAKMPFTVIRLNWLSMSKKLFAT